MQSPPRDLWLLTVLAAAAAGEVAAAEDGAAVKVGEKKRRDAHKSVVGHKFTLVENLRNGISISGSSRLTTSTRKLSRPLESF